MKVAGYIKQIVGIALKELRESRSLTQDQLAEALGLQTYQTINRIENGKAFPSYDLLEKICNYFDIEPALLFMKRPKITDEKYTSMKKELNTIISSLSPSRIKDIYNIALLFQK